MSEHSHQVDPIVVGVDGSTSSIGALDWAASECERTAASLFVVAAWEWPTNYGWAVPLPDGYRPADDAQHLVDECEARVRSLHPSVDVKGVTVEGNPAAELVDVSRGASLLVVGSRGHGRLADMLIGSVSKHCAAHAHCPVVVYRDDATEPAPAAGGR